MGMVVRTNAMAINANRQLGMNQSQVSKSLEKLSSGFKINRAADDASGLAISEKMKAQIKGLDQAASNSQDGISLIQTAEGATTEIHDMLNRMVELATKSANGTIKNEVDREAIQREVDDLNSEITRIAKSTNFNGINLLDGSLGGVSIKNNPVGNGGTAPTVPPVTTTVESLGDGAGTPAKFSISISDDVLKNGGKLTIGDHSFTMSGNLATAAVTDHAVDIDGKTKEAALTALASEINTVFGANKLGGQNFGAAVVDGKIVLTATTDTALVAEDGTTALTKEDLTGMISATAGTSGGEPTPPESSTVAVSGTTVAGKAQDLGTAAKYEIDLGAEGALVAGKEIEINGKTYKLQSDATADGDKVIVDISSAATTADKVDALIAKINTENASLSTDYTVDKDSTDTDHVKITLEAKTPGAVTDGNGPLGLGGASGSDPSPAVEGKVAFQFTGASVTDGAKIKLNGTEYTVALGADSANKDAANKIDLTGIAGTTATDKEYGDAVKAALDTITAITDDYNIANDGNGKITLTQKTAADVNTDTLEGLVSDVSVDPASIPAFASATPAPARAGDVAGGDDAKGSATINMTSQPKANSTITVGEGDNAVVFEFVAKAGDAVKSAGATAIVIGADTKATMNNLKTALDGAGIADISIAQDANTGAITITNENADVDANDAAPTIKTAGGGLGLQVGDTNEDFNKVTVSVDDLSAAGIGTAGLDVSNQDAAGAAIDIIKAAINKVSTNRANLGSLQNRLEHTINNLNVTSENMTAANSAIRDTDMAKEMMNYTKMNVLTQAAQAMLAQANQQPQAILQLLQ